MLILMRKKILFYANKISLSGSICGGSRKFCQRGPDNVFVFQASMYFTKGRTNLPQEANWAQRGPNASRGGVRTSISKTYSHAFVIFQGGEVRTPCPPSSGYTHAFSVCLYEIQTRPALLSQADFWINRKMSWKLRVAFSITGIRADLWINRKLSWKPRVAFSIRTSQFFQCPNMTIAVDGMFTNNGVLRP